ncbi:MAG: DUF72 domain-containing protein [Alphaproteobacteria bacterium]
MGARSAATHSGPHAFIGTSGWSYSHWRAHFYEKRPAGRWLAHYATQFDSVELNNTFYGLPKPSFVARWAEVTPPDFRFAVKAWRAITHDRRLQDCAEPLQQFYASIAPLKEKTAIVLFQMHPRMAPDIPRLKTFLGELSRDWRYVFELRDPGWHRDDVYALLNGHDIATAHSLWPGDVTPRVVTGTDAYVRFHGTTAKYQGLYGEETLRGIARWLQREAPQRAFCYFNNTYKGFAALEDAKMMQRLLK